MTTLTPTTTPEAPTQTTVTPLQVIDHALAGYTRIATEARIEAEEAKLAPPAVAEIDRSRAEYFETARTVLINLRAELLHAIPAMMAEAKAAEAATGRPVFPA
jgi:hypothetical protein